MSILQNLAKLSKPEDFINHYYTELKSWFNNQDLILSKDGYVGTFLHILGNLQFDLKYYYNYLFRESFPITAVENQNLIYHANLHGYNLQLAKSATIDGMFNFNFSTIPTPSLSIYKREIFLKNIEISVSNIKYKLDADYKIVQLRDGNTYNYIVVVSRDTETLTIPISEPNMFIDVYDLNQYETEIYTINIPSYPRGNFYKQSLSVLSDYISDLKIKVKTIDSDVFETFDTKFAKEFAISSDAIVFATISDTNELFIETGNGIKGRYIPSSTMEVTLYKTKGNVGNVKNGVKNTISGDLHIYDYDINGDPISNEFTILPIRNFITLDINEGRHGRNPDDNTTLRNNLISYIQSRETIISKLDFNNLMDNYFDVYELLFKKTQLIDNTFYLYYPLRNKIFEPVYSTTTTYSISEFEENLITIDETKYVYSPEKVINNKTFISPFLYVFDNLLNFYQG
jgi:hypothetical protein